MWSEYATPSVRADIITRRSYNRPVEHDSDTFETWEETVSRVIEHQTWLWRRAKKSNLKFEEIKELVDLEQLLLNRKALVAGRTLWLGGTETAKRRESSQFNCSFLKVHTVHDVVDGFWLLLQGCGVGFEPCVGTLNGFTRPLKSVRSIRSSITMKEYRAGYRGAEHNSESFYTNEDGEDVYILTIGDSAEAWAKAPGKLLAMKQGVDHIILDFSQIRPGGIRLKGYGWISSGDETICNALEQICRILDRRVGELLTRIDILDIMNWLGTTLSSRRSAEIALVPYNDPEWEDFALAKKEHWKNGQQQRSMSNNSIKFYNRPTKNELRGIFSMMQEGGGSEPGFINAQAALERAPYFKGVNPCGEILLGDKSFCNLVEVNWARFKDDPDGLLAAIRLIARANYRQTCVNLHDGILQHSWHELNNFLHLCGVGLTGYVVWEEAQNKTEIPKALEMNRYMAQQAAYSMADELGLPRPKNVTTVKPSGTQSKVCGTVEHGEVPEGIHRPLGKYIFNNVNFSLYDPVVNILKNAGYRTRENPYDPTGVIVTLPVVYEGVKFTRKTLDNGRVVEVNTESAVNQLDRYLLLMRHYVDNNASITVSYDQSEINSIINWLHKHWDEYVGVSFIYRNDPTKTASDLGYPYLPQEVVTQEEYEEYVSTLQPVDLNAIDSYETVDVEECSGGACPIR